MTEDVEQGRNFGRDIDVVGDDGGTLRLKLTVYDADGDFVTNAEAVVEAPPDGRIVLAGIERGIGAEVDAVETGELETADRSDDTPDDAVVRVTEGAPARGERTIYLSPGQTHDHRDDDASFCFVEVIDEDRGRAPDDRDVDDIMVVGGCRECGATPAAAILTDGEIECYHCGGEIST